MAKIKNPIRIQLSRNFTKADESTYYYEIPFELPENTEQFTFKKVITELGSGHSTIDLGIRDHKRIRGWSGGTNKTFMIGEEKASPGYLPGDLEGPWAILIGTYKVSEGGVSVTIEIECTLKEGRWLKGDLHLHTTHSDGSQSLEENVRIMEGLGCDFMAMTDHNTISQNYTYPHNTSLILIPGMELTTKLGHSNFYGVGDPEVDFRVTNQDALNRAFKQARDKGSRISLNHPHCPNCGWKFGFEVDYDYIEVWNGATKEANRETLTWWHNAIVSGKKMVIIGGSDSHNLTQAKPTTYVFSYARTVKGILQGIDQGHVFISNSPIGPTIDMKYGHVMMGDTVNKIDQCDESELIVKLDQLVNGDLVKVISDLGVEQEVQYFSESNVNLHISVKNRKFYRTEVWCEDEMAAISNPIYFE